MYRKYFKILIVLLTIVLVASCSKEKNTSQEIFNHLEKAAELEKGFNNQQQPLVDAEKKEQQLYNQIIALDMSKYNQIVTLSNEALDSIKNREDFLSKEKQSMDQAYQEFLKTKPLIAQLTDKSLKEKANVLYATMVKRYNTYQDLHNAYAASISEDKKLYTMFKDKKLSIENLQKQIDVVNNGYKKINDDKDTFNKYTGKFNKEKKDFYQAAGINIK